MFHNVAKKIEKRLTVFERARTKPEPGRGAASVKRTIETGHTFPVTLPPTDQYITTVLKRGTQKEKQVY